MSPVPVLPVVKNASGAWSCVVPVVHGSDDVDVRDANELASLRTERARVDVQGTLRDLTVYVVDDDDAFVVWSEALPE
jgi:hypothetical protein